MEKILLVPGAFQAVKNYGGYHGVDIWLKSTPVGEVPPAACYIGHSGGASFILPHYGSLPGSRFIFVNTLVKKTGAAALFYDWMRFFIHEGIPMKKMVPVGNWWHGIKMVRRLLKVDVTGVMQRIPKENLVVIRGKNDKYLCDDESADIIRNSGIKLIEVDAGHDWNENIAKAVEDESALWQPVVDFTKVRKGGIPVNDLLPRL